MFYSVVIDPNAFHKKIFEEKGKAYFLEAKYFFRDIAINGLIITDNHGRLLNQLKDSIKNLPAKYQKGLEIHLDQFAKKGSKRIIVFDCNKFDFPSDTSDFELLCDLTNNCNPDALISEIKRIDKINASGTYELIILENYSESKFQEYLREALHGLPQLDMLSKDKCDDIFIHILRFARSLHFYDGYIGRIDKYKSYKSYKRYEKGLSYILSVWKKHGFFLHQAQAPSVKIITRPPHGGDANQTYKDIRENIIEKLEKQFNLQIDLCLKDDPDNLMHDRFLHAEPLIVQFGRGFDLFNREGKFFRQVLSIQNGARKHLKECKALKDAVSDN